MGVVLFGLVGASAPNGNTLRVATSWLRLPPVPDVFSLPATLTAIALSCLGTLGMLRAHREGWSPDPRRLFQAGALVTIVIANVTPVGSSDTASYAAYGRIAALGGDPYVTTPAHLGGAYADLVGAAWRDAPSVYGPVATWWQAAAAFVGGDRPWLTIWVLMLANAAVFLGTGYLLTRTADDPVRAGLLWSANPLMIGVMVAGGHLDTLVACLAVCAVRLATRGSGWQRDLIVGALVGLACGVKISSALLGVGLAWPLLRSGAWLRAARQAGAAASTLAVFYGFYGLHALAPLSAASHQVALPSVWAVFEWITTGSPAGHGALLAVPRLLWPACMLALAVVLRRRVPADTPAVGAVPFALAFAWILTAPWSMPWYAAFAWAPAAMFSQGTLLTRYLVVITAVMASVHSGGGHGWTW
ncbi:hypothetical protein RKE30_39545 [Streptomyces sp. Li-HN-5-11]|uniref:hypothetical protein n=1 Tax=Streptomyces sp. Li-HN-5-11 TaxID=3075432 RepID=UPI0028B07311|nr:hypothetical protein [Streptomyces sp. Li-HN-5-11]WNM36020.1 hypothetical protein RKE30_39545 [Streptomyces sp. Li-HN-5-11]